MIYIDFEVIVKYHGDILKLESELGVSVEILSPIYAIITSSTEENIDILLSYPEIEYVEKPFILETQDTQSFSATGISSFKNRTKLTGKGTIIGLIDSGIDYTLPIFRDSNGNSKILYYWDQSIEGKPPEGFREGTLYTNEDINKAINGGTYVPISTTSTHGTHVAGIAAGIASEASIIAVRVGRRQTDVFSRSTEFMRAIKFILDRSLELNMPVAINISYGSNEGSHRGLSLFEQYIDDMCLFWKNNIVVAAGNNGDKGGHKRINLTQNGEVEVEFVVGDGERILNLNIWPNFADDLSIKLITPSNKQSQEISLTSGRINSTIGSTRISGYFYPIAPYSLQRRVTIQLSSNTKIDPGIWRIVFTPIEIIDGEIDIYLPTSEGLSRDTKFLSPSQVLTVTVPGTASNVITVGSFNSRTDTVSTFSGQGDVDNGIIKPDLLAPGEGIVSYLPGGTTGALTGTSMATPHVTGVCLLLMQWGIVEKNDLFLYSQKVKAYLATNARRSINNPYPNNAYGYGLLDLSSINLESLSNANQDIETFFRNLYNVNSRDLETYMDNMFGGVVIKYLPGFYDDLERLGLLNEFLPLSDDIGVLSPDISSPQNFTHELYEIYDSNNIRGTENLIRMVLLDNVSQGTFNGTTATEEIGVNFFKNNPNLSITGRGVIIGIIDTGIDYLHQDFIYEDGTSKIISIWDQTKEGTPPEGFKIGVEYTREEINDAIANNNPDLSIDEEGHGTMISGICAGLGNVNKEYTGIAEDAELIVVKLEKINGYYNNATSIIASNYIRKKARELRKPLVLVGTLGTNTSAGVDKRIDSETIFFNRGLTKVQGIGNEGNTETHSSGIIEYAGQSVEEKFEINEIEEELIIQIWLSRPDKARVEIISPSGEVSRDAGVSYFTLSSGRFNLENTSYIINYVYPTTYSGQLLINITLSNVASGIWTIRLTGEYITQGRYNIYLQNRKLLKEGTRLLQSNPNYTVNYPAVLSDLIIVGAYNTIERTLWPSSSRGPDIRGKQKPDIVAPGVNIIAPYPGNTYGTITGTGCAAAHVAGAVAMFFQYILVEDRYPSQGYTQMINTFFEAGATRVSSLTYPNMEYGYGLLNVRGVFERFR